MRSLVFTLILLLGSTASAATVASEVSTSVRNAYRNDFTANKVSTSVRNAYRNDFTANMVVTKVMGAWNQKVINGHPVDANAEIKFYAAELRKHGIELHLIATPVLRPLLKVNGL